MSVATAVSTWTDRAAVNKLREHLGDNKFVPDTVDGPHGVGNGVYWIVRKSFQRYRVPMVGKVTKA